MRIVLVYLNDDEKLKRCLDSLKKFSPEIPIDLIKADKTKTKIAEELYNEYIKTAEDDIMLWHSDMIATEGWYQKVLMYWDYFDVMGCKLVYPNGLIQHYGGAIRCDGVGIHPHQHTLDFGLINPLEVAFVTGPSMIIKKHVFKEIQWDLNFLSYPDVDFCFQARRKGFRVGVIPVKLIHEEAQERDRDNEYERLTSGCKRFIAKWGNELRTAVNETP